MTTGFSASQRHCFEDVLSDGQILGSLTKHELLESLVYEDVSKLSAESIIDVMTKTTIKSRLRILYMWTKAEQKRKNINFLKPDKRFVKQDDWANQPLNWSIDSITNNYCDNPLLL
jgi:hypothetical protein